MQVNQVRAGAILSYVSMAVSTILSLVYAPIMKGQLGTSEYGVYGSVGPIIAYLLLLSMGLGSAYMRYYSQAKVAQDRRTMAKLNGMFLVTYTVLGLVLLVPALEPVFAVVPLSAGRIGAAAGLAFGSMLTIQLLKLLRR